MKRGQNVTVKTLFRFLLEYRKRVEIFIVKKGALFALKKNSIWLKNQVDHFLVE
jgi:hypothetical protein